MILPPQDHYQALNTLIYSGIRKFKALDMGFPGIEQRNSVGMDLELCGTCGIMVLTNLL